MASSVLAASSFAGSALLARSSCKANAQTSAPRGLVRCSAEKDAKTRRDVLQLAAAALVGGWATQARADSLTEALLAKSQANKELNDRKRLATSSANQGRAYTVQNGTCKFPENFTGCQDAARRQNVKFITDDLKVECEGKETGKCSSNNLY